MPRRRKTTTPQVPLVLLDPASQRLEIETYNPPTWTIRASVQDFSFVNTLCIRRYRVVVELIDEPVEVLRERLVKLWRETPRNMHQLDDFMRAAAELGIELDRAAHGVDSHEARR